MCIFVPIWALKIGVEVGIGNPNNLKLYFKLLKKLLLVPIPFLEKTVLGLIPNKIFAIT